jgi:hypothetical protein
LQVEKELLDHPERLLVPKHQNIYLAECYFIYGKFLILKGEKFN